MVQSGDVPIAHWSDEIDVAADMLGGKIDYDKKMGKNAEISSISADTNARKALIDKRKKDGHKQGSDEYKKAQTEIINHSELIALKASDQYMRDLGFTPVMNKIAKGGSGEFDLIYKKGDKYAIIEAKGGKSTLGSRKVTGKQERAAQGSKKYLEEILDVMKEKDKKLYKQLKEALEIGDLQYFVARQKFKPDNTIGDFDIKEFDLTKQK